jgi:hypothetical protein
VDVCIGHCTLHRIVASLVCHVRSAYFGASFYFMLFFNGRAHGEGNQKYLLDKRRAWKMCERAFGFVVESFFILCCTARYPRSNFS